MNGIHKGAVMWILHFFKNNQAAYTLNSKIALRSNSLRECQKEEKLTTHCEGVKNLLETYNTENIIAESDAILMRVTHLLNKTMMKYAKWLWATALRRNRVYDEY